MLDLLGSLDVSTKRERRARRERDATEVDLARRLGRAPTTEELATALGTTVADLDRLAAREEVSLDDEMAHGAEPVADEVAPEEAATRQELARAVGECLAALRAEMRVVVTGRLLDGLTLQALGRLLRGSKDRIWRLEQAARRSLRSCLQGKGWEAADAIAVIDARAR
jgi:RNA polymerase sigma factor for flagellar operon FliA